MHGNALSKQQQLQHLYLRAGFGAEPGKLRKLTGETIGWHVERLFEAAGKVTPLNVLRDPTKGQRKDVGIFKLAVLVLRSRRELQQLNGAWLEQMATTEAQLREKMTLFWHDHFATHVPIAYLMQVQNNTLRRHALGNFAQMLHAISRDAAMLLYLNNHQNQKDHPNENFAREVMELFTLGEGHYTEQDIKEAARAFTGWQTDNKGNFKFNAEQHDFGEKTFLGKTGKFNGEEIIDILLEQRQTARYITRKIYAYFVNEKIDEGRVENLAMQFYDSGYDVRGLLKAIFGADWFYQPENVGALVKSPVELLVQYMRLLRARFKRQHLLVQTQRLLGQILFYPPNVSGWPSGTAWIDSSTLLLRMRLPLVYFGADELDIQAKPEYEDVGPDISKRRIPRYQKAEVEWKYIATAFSGVADDHMHEAIIEALIQCPKVNIDRGNLLAYADNSGRVNLIKSLVLRTMALPEFQLK